MLKGKQTFIRRLRFKKGYSDLTLEEKNTMNEVDLTYCYRNAYKTLFYSVIFFLIFLFLLTILINAYLAKHTHYLFELGILIGYFFAFFWMFYKEYRFFKKNIKDPTYYIENQIRKEAKLLEKYKGKKIR